METILAGITRQSFNHLYKYGEITLPENALVKSRVELTSSESISKMKELARKLEYCLPHFEADHEVLLIECDRAFMFGYTLEFRGVISIIPLTLDSRDIFLSKLNPQFNFKEPLLTELLEEIRLQRQRRIRSRAAALSIKVLGVGPCSHVFQSLVQTSINHLILDKQLSEQDNSIAHALGFNVTPSFIPSGNIEGIIKLICLGTKILGYDISNVPKGPVYQLIVENKSQLNDCSLIEGYDMLMEIIDACDNSIKEKYHALSKTLSFDEEHDSMLVLYLYFSWKTFLDTNNYDLSHLIAQVEKTKYLKEVSAVIYLLGYTLSMDRLFESLHRLNHTPIFKKDDINKLVREPLVTEVSKSDKRKEKVKPSTKNTSFVSLFGSQDSKLNLLDIVKKELKGKEKKIILEELNKNFNEKSIREINEVERILKLNKTLLKPDKSLKKSALDTLKILIENL